MESWHWLRKDQMLGNLCGDRPGNLLTSRLANQRDGSLGQDINGHRGNCRGSGSPCIGAFLPGWGDPTALCTVTPGASGAPGQQRPHPRWASEAGPLSRPVDCEAGGQRSSTPGHHCDRKLCAPRIPLASSRPLTPTTVAIISPVVPTPTHCVPVMATRVQEGLRLSMMGLGVGAHPRAS